MRFLNGLLIVFATLIAIFIGSSYLLPAGTHVERAIVIEAKPAEIFPYINNLRRFPEWFPFGEVYTNMEFTLSGPEEGVGAKVSWHDSEREALSGSWEILESTPNSKVVTALNVYAIGKAQASFLIQPESYGTKVTWSLDTAPTLNPFIRWFGLILEDIVGPYYVDGLFRLKLGAERGAA